MSRGLRTLARWVGLFAEPRKLAGLFYLPRYLSHWWQYSARAPKPLRFVDAYPCLGDWVKSTPFDPHYFYQASWLARRLAISEPSHHVDVGSDVRLIGVLSAFVSTEFIDYRPLQVDLRGLSCSAGNVASLGRATASIASLSCLHVIEHVGLGRYGDPIDPLGSEKALKELQRVLSPGGRLYLSAPVGRERVFFNAHRVFSPSTILKLLSELSLVEFSLVDDAGNFKEMLSPDAAENMDYGCGLFILERQ